MLTFHRQWIDALPTLASALEAQGMAWHSQLNQPVYSGISMLATHVHVRFLSTFTGRQ
jgi:hypothetical protein